MSATFREGLLLCFEMQIEGMDVSNNFRIFGSFEFEKKNTVALFSAILG